MTMTLRHAIDAATLENDLDALTDILHSEEAKFDVVCLIYERIDLVCANLARPIEVEILEIA